MQTKRAVDQNKQVLKAVCPRVQILLDMLEIDMRGIDAEYVMREAKRMDVVDAEGGATTELLSANVAKVGQLLIDSGLPQLLTGEWLETDDKLVAAVARELSSAEFQRELNRATWLNVRIGRGEGATPIKTINSVCRALGIVVESRQTKAGGRKRSLYRYLIPVRGGTT